MCKVVVRLAWVATATVIWAGPSLGSAAAAELRVATFRCDVTPPLGYLTYPPAFKPLEKIEHPLLAKGIVLDDGHTAVRPVRHRLVRDSAIRRTTCSAARWPKAPGPIPHGSRCIRSTSTPRRSPTTTPTGCSCRPRTRRRAPT